MKIIRIAHLYPAEMNIYGDRGNILTLTKRLEWRGYTVKVDPIEPGARYNFSQADLVFGGGGQDRGQLVIASDLISRQNQLKQAAETGVPMLVICGTYQLFGRGFKTKDGQLIP